MPAATITSKGQVTVPIEIRRRLGLRPGDRVNFVVDETGEVRLLPKKRSLLDLLGKLKDRGRPVVSVAGMKEGVAEAVAEDWARIASQDSK